MAVKDFDQAVQNVTVDGLTAICGGGGFETIQVLASEVLTRLSTLIDATSGLLAALSCESLVPLYVSTQISSVVTNLHFLTLRPFLFLRIKDKHVFRWHV